jgi:hypothetical protein
VDVKKAIWTFEVPRPDERGVATIHTDGGSIQRILSAGRVNGVVVVWAEVRVEPNYPSAHELVIVAAGREINSSITGDYVGSVVLGGIVADMVWHVFERRQAL